MVKELAEIKDNIEEIIFLKKLLGIESEEFDSKLEIAVKSYLKAVELAEGI